MDGDGHTDLPIKKWWRSNGDGSVFEACDDDSECTWEGSFPLPDVTGDGAPVWLDLLPHPEVEYTDDPEVPADHQPAQLRFASGDYDWADRDAHFGSMDSWSLPIPDPISPYALSHGWSYDGAGSVGDLNGDGYPDIVVSHGGAGLLHIVPGSPAPSAADAITLPAVPSQWPGLGFLKAL